MDLKTYKQTRTDTNWTTGLGDKIPVKRMESSHVQNTIIYLTNKQEECNKLSLGDFVVNGKKANDWIEMLKTELKYRINPNSIIPTEVKQEVKTEVKLETTIEPRRTIML